MKKIFLVVTAAVLCGLFYGADARAFTLVEICKAPSLPPLVESCCLKCGTLGTPTDFKCCIDSGAATCSCVPPKNGCTTATDCPDDTDPCTTPICIKSLASKTGVCDFDKSADCGCKTDADCPDPVANDCKGRKCDVAKGLCVDTVIPAAECNPPCVKPPPPPSECGKDADCEKDLDPCTAPHCSLTSEDGVCPDGTKWSYTIGKCGAETPIPGCHDCPKCPQCPPPPKIDCDLIGDKMKDCCVAKGGLLWFVMDKCVEHGPGGTEDCSNIAEHVENSGTFQQCCLINNGIITGDINMCNNNWTPGGGPSPTGGTTTGTPTTPAALGACQVQCKDADCSIAVDTGGQGVGWVVSYSPPPGIGAVASVVLKQVEGPAMTAEEPAPSGTNALSIKTITDPSSLPSFIVYTAKPQSSLQGEYLPKFKLAVQLNDLADHELATLTCGNDTALEAKGSGGCGCFFGASPLEFGVNALLIALFGAPFVLRRRRFRRE